MCVISLIEYVRPTDEQIHQMYEANKFGGGAAWRDLSTEGQRVVKWKKGLLEDEMLELNRTLPMPYVLHFRVPSPNTSTSFLACHPFQIDADASTGFEGETTGFVLFHNGHWTDWKHKMQQIALSGFVKVPSGPWSDSRSLAWAAYHLGTGFLDLADEKICVLGPNADDVEIFGGWFEVDQGKALEDGTPQSFLVTNRTWEPTVVTYPIHDRKHHTPPVGQPGGAAQQTPFPVAIGRIAPAEGSGSDSGRDQQQPVQKADESAGKDDAKGESVKPCATCQSTKRGMYVDGKFFCWQCWSDREKKLERPFIGMCATCKVTAAAAKTSEGDQWICITCWDVASQPKVYFKTNQLREQVH